MVVTGFMGSPRKKGNTSYLLNTVIEELEDRGAETHLVHVPDKNIHPCTGCSLCEKKGFCHFDDDMQNEIFPLIRKSDIIIIATPVCFYNAPSELKTLIDRTQTLWARKYKLGLTDPAEKTRQGIMLAVGAEKGKDLFDGLNLTMKYFCKGIGADFTGGLNYGGIQDLGDMKSHPTIHGDAEKTAYDLMIPFERKRTVLFTCREDTERSQMAAAFARSISGDRLNIMSAGSYPANTVNPKTILVMAEKGIDLEFRKPEQLDHVILHSSPEYVVSIGSGEETCTHIPDSKSKYWWIPEPGDKPIEFYRVLRDEIEEKVQLLINDILNS